MGFWAKLVNDSEKSINPAHVIALALTFGVICWVSFLVWKTHMLPDLAGPAYLLGGSGALNVAHKAEDIIEKFKPAQTPVAPPAFPTPPPMAVPTH